MDQTLLTSALVGAVVGAFAGSLFKFFWERWLPEWLTWKREQRLTRKRVLSEQREPSVRAINELKSRLWVTITKDARNYHYTKSRGRSGYYIDSTAFLIAQYFAWSEVMRRYIAALDYQELSKLLDDVSDSFAHGGPGFQFFRLEQREIGERVLDAEALKGATGNLRYATFVDLVAGAEPHESLVRLQRTTERLFTHLSDERSRAVRIHNSLVELLDFIDPDTRWIPQDRRAKIDEGNGADQPTSPSEA
jgi:hypothetical protein